MNGNGEVRGDKKEESGLGKDLEDIEKTRTKVTTVTGKVKLKE